MRDGTDVAGVQLLADGGAIYTTWDGMGSTVAYNHLEGDPVQYGVIYHDAGSANWHDRGNVVNHAESACIFTHGSCPNVTESYSWYVQLSGLTFTV